AAAGLRIPTALGAVQPNRVNLFRGVRVVVGVDVDLYALNQVRRHWPTHGEVRRAARLACVRARPDRVQHAAGVEHIDLRDENVAQGLANGDAIRDDRRAKAEGEVLLRAVL